MSEKAQTAILGSYRVVSSTAPPPAWDKPLPNWLDYGRKALFCGDSKLSVMTDDGSWKIAEPGDTIMLFKTGLRILSKAD
jgi:hypothetical protein